MNEHYFDSYPTVEASGMCTRRTNVETTFYLCLYKSLQVVVEEKAIKLFQRNI